jgi:hypothetical protein
MYRDLSKKIELANATRAYQYWVAKELYYRNQPNSSHNWHIMQDAKVEASERLCRAEDALTKRKKSRTTVNLSRLIRNVNSTSIRCIDGIPF